MYIFVGKEILLITKSQCLWGIASKEKSNKPCNLRRFCSICDKHTVNKKNLSVLRNKKDYTQFERLCKI